MSITLAEAQTQLSELIARLQPGDVVEIKQDGLPVARLTKCPETSWPCQPGSAKHLPHWMAPDFNAPLDDFREYME